MTQRKKVNDINKIFEETVGKGAVWYTMTGSKSVKPKNGKDFHYTELQLFVGGFFETIKIGDYLIIVDEEGLLKGSQANPAMEKLGLDIVGNAVVMHNLLLQ